MTAIKIKFNEIKARYPDALILFKIDDTYVAIEQDANNIANCLGTVLTRNKENIPCTEYQFHSLDIFLPKLVRAGNKVAICEPIAYIG